MPERCRFYCMERTGKMNEQQRKTFPIDRRGDGQEISRIIMEIQSNAGVLNGKVIAKMNNVGHNSGRVSGPGEAKLQMPSVGPVAEVRSAAVGLRPYMSGETKWGSGELVLQIEYLDADESKF